MQLERTKDNLEENLQRTKADRSDKEQRVVLLEGEIERYKIAQQKRDARIEELEKLRQVLYIYSYGAHTVGVISRIPLCLLGCFI